MERKDDERLVLVTIRVDEISVAELREAFARFAETFARVAVEITAAAERFAEGLRKALDAAEMLAAAVAACQNMPEPSGPPRPSYGPPASRRRFPVPASVRVPISPSRGSWGPVKGGTVPRRWHLARFG